MASIQEPFFARGPAVYRRHDGLVVADVYHLPNVKAVDGARVIAAALNARSETIHLAMSGQQDEEHAIHIAMSERATG